MLLEALVALAILSTGIVVLAGTVAAALRAEERASATDAELADADRLLAALTLLTAKEYDQRLGQRDWGEYRVDIQRPEPGLYRIGLSPLGSPGIELLSTVVYRAGEAP
jgi:hypothetical protein